MRWKKAHIRVAEEMENHIFDQRDSYMTQGLDEDTATDKAITDTGDAAAIGAQLDRIHRPKPQWTMLLATAVLLIFGLLIRMLIFNDGDQIDIVSKRLLITGIGIAGMLIAYFVDFSLLGKYPKAIYFAIVAFSLVTYFISPIVNGRSGYGIYFVLLFPLAFSLIIYTTRSKGYIGIILCLLAFIIPCIITLIISTMSGFVHFAVIGMVMLSIAICKNWFGVKRLYGFLIILASAVITAIGFITNMSDYHLMRLTVALNPSLDPDGGGYWSNMARGLLEGAKLFGQGHITEKYRAALTESGFLFYIDSLLTSVIALVGWAAFIVIIGVLLFFIIKGFHLCLKQKSGLGFFVSLAIILTISMQVISYVIFNLGFQFVSPISLPLVSYGNTATLINLGLIGFMLSVFRTGDVVADEKYPPSHKHRFISWDDGKLTIFFKA
ncbi:MAG: permease prefix domain 1-containing protein [Lachnospiraceae bacterium]